MREYSLIDFGISGTILSAEASTLGWPPGRCAMEFAVRINTVTDPVLFVYDRTKFSNDEAFKFCYTSSTGLTAEVFND